MTISGVRFFYLFHNEDEVTKNLILVIKNSEFGLEYNMGGGTSEAKQPLIPDSARLSTTDNMLVCSLFLTDNDLANSRQRINVLENAGLINEGFLGKITLVVYDDHDSWQQLSHEAEATWERQIIYHLDTPELNLARLGWLWPNQETIYIAQASKLDARLVSFFDLGLAQVEAAALKLHTISDLYISQSKYISQEKNRLDRTLSELLRQQSTLDFSSENLADFLEKNLNELSNAYVVISGYYRVIREAHTSTAGLLSALRRRISRDPVMANQRSINALFLDYYLSRLTTMRDIQKELQSSLNDHQAAIELIQGRIDLMNSRENLRLQHRLGAVMELNTSLQEQSLTFQIAASLIEFIILAYYSLSMFKYLAPTAYHHVPSWLLLLLFSSFAGAAVMGTHVVAERMLGKQHKNTGSIIVSLLLLITLGTIFYLAARF